MTEEPSKAGVPSGTANGDDTDGGDLTAFRMGALTSQSQIDRAKSMYGAAFEASAYRAEEIGWDGLTKAQEIQQDRLWRERVIAEAEYEQQMQEVRDSADALIAQIDEQERQCREQLDEINEKLDQTKKRPITLSDGRVVEPDTNGQFTTDANGRVLTDAEKADALRQQQKKEADEQVLEAAKQAREDQLAQLDDAKASAEQARDLASQGGSNLTPEQRAEAQSKLAKAQAIAQAAAPQQTHYETDASASSTLSSTDTLAALGLGGTPDRTTSFSASLDQKDSRSTVLQNQFTGAAQNAPLTPPDDQAPAGNTVQKTQIVQPNQ